MTNTGSYQLVVTNSYGAVTSAPSRAVGDARHESAGGSARLQRGHNKCGGGFLKTAGDRQRGERGELFLCQRPAGHERVVCAERNVGVARHHAAGLRQQLTVIVNGVRDQAVPPNTVAPNSTASFTASPVTRRLLDFDWRFKIGDPSDVTTNVTYYPEISDLSKLQTGDLTGAGSETNLMTLRANPVATHAGENVSLVQTNYDDSAWRQLDLPHDWFVELGFTRVAARITVTRTAAARRLRGIATRSSAIPPLARCFGWNLTAFFAMR